MIHQDNYSMLISSHTDYEELRVELHINREMAVVVTQEAGLGHAQIEFWYPDNREKWTLDYHCFCTYLDQLLDKLALKKVSPTANPQEAKAFKHELIKENEFTQPLVKLYFKEDYLGLISQEEGPEQAVLEIVACPYSKYWEFSYRGFTDFLNESYSLLTRI